jgi:hypothetical protein
LGPPTCTDSVREDLICGSSRYEPYAHGQIRRLSGQHSHELRGSFAPRHAAPVSVSGLNATPVIQARRSVHSKRERPISVADRHDRRPTRQGARIHAKDRMAMRSPNTLYSACAQVRDALRSARSSAARRDADAAGLPLGSTDRAPPARAPGDREQERAARYPAARGVPERVNAQPGQRA